MQHKGYSIKEIEYIDCPDNLGMAYKVYHNNPSKTEMIKQLNSNSDIFFKLRTALMAIDVTERGN